jgi:predicted nicotinamide N-methyase
LRAHLGGRTGLAESEVGVRGRAYRILHPASADDLIDEEEFELDERLPYWAELWPSAIALARDLAGRDLAGKRCIELGCGVGLPSVAALSRGARVTATDHYEAALDFARYNALANLGRELSTALLDWHAPRAESLGGFDLVLAADVLYERRNAESLAALVPDLLAPGGEVMLADPGRNEAERFLKLMQERGLSRSTRVASAGGAGGEVTVLLHHLRL